MFRQYYIRLYFAVIFQFLKNFRSIILRRQTAMAVEIRQHFCLLEMHHLRCSLRKSADNLPGISCNGIFFYHVSVSGFA